MTLKQIIRELRERKKGTKKTFDKFSKSFLEEEKMRRQLGKMTG